MLVPPTIVKENPKISLAVVLVLIAIAIITVLAFKKEQPVGEADPIDDPTKMN